MIYRTPLDHISDSDRTWLLNQIPLGGVDVHASLWIIGTARKLDRSEKEWVIEWTPKFFKRKHSPRWTYVSWRIPYSRLEPMYHGTGFVLGLYTPLPPRKFV